MTDDPLQHAATATAEIAVEPFGDEDIRDELIVQAIGALGGPDVEVHPGLMSTVVSGKLFRPTRRTGVTVAAVGTAYDRSGPCRSRAWMEKPKGLDRPGPRRSTARSTSSDPVVGVTM